MSGGEGTEVGSARKKLAHADKTETQHGEVGPTTHAKFWTRERMRSVDFPNYRDAGISK
eukprot:CAMPEP_0181194116 /NCGR_PEP_ID=MMETSP1096-20121128/14169_1 /TAXON_ID=156174 ORGANISM="Chrysochromulina ericina, Strain CCMP281" /NCGR_SAMPLE_ID=MMETSP1096 /ASSEMBLY_ACC=CAM_ASM_000453 /LENGTH=58 /DNA_ID=CAMNT_0023283605 /DNA_START=164 /DNA_END=337 /DNA_ORIENTATION=+